MSSSNQTKAVIMKTPEKICRLCSTLVLHEICVLENTHKDIVEIILPDVKIEDSDEVYMCKICDKLLQEFFQFKSTCLEIEDNIHNYTLDGQVQVDLEKIIGLNDMDHEKNGKICRMCLEFIQSGSFSELDTDNSSLVQMQQKCLPEMDLQLTKEPVMCDKCENLLKKCFDFLNQCMDNEETYLKRMKVVEKEISTPKRNINKPKKRAPSLRSHGIDSDSSGEDPDFVPEGESEDISDLEEEPQPKTKKRTPKSSNNNLPLHCLYCSATFASNDQISVHMAQCKTVHENDSSMKSKVTTNASEDTPSQPERENDPVESSNSLEHGDTAAISSITPGADNLETTQALEKCSMNSGGNLVKKADEQLGRYTISTNYRELVILKCDTCELNTRSFLKIEQHVLSHLHRLRFKTQLLCPHCQKKFDSEQEIYLHLKDKHSRCNYKKFHWCVNCTKIFSNRKGIVSHWNDCPRKNYMCKLFKSNQTMFCMLCNFESDNEKEAKAHRDSCQYKSETLVGDTIELD